MNFPRKMELRHNLIQSALHQVDMIKHAHNTLRKSAKQNFNLFQGLAGNKFHLEKYHSNFISYLLNPKESHDCGSFFLKKFIDKIKDKVNERTGFTGLFSSTNTLSDEELDIENVKLSKEEEIETGRKIDITIKSLRNNWIIFIENKLDSGEGRNQVKDYYEWSKKNYSEKILGIYLTLDSKDPDSIKDIEDAKKKILAISYRFIIVWLEECCVDKETIRYPHIINSLLQYVTVLKLKLNIMEDAEKEELKNWLKKNGDASVQILTNIEGLREANIEAVREIRKDFQKQLIEEVVQNLVLEPSNGLQLEHNELGFLLKDLKGLIFVIRIDQEFPNRDKDGDGKGLWWGVAHTNFEPILCDLKEGSWESVNLDGTEDFVNDKEGYEKIIKSYQSDGGKKLLGETAKLIVDRINKKVLPVLTGFPNKLNKLQ